MRPNRGGKRVPPGRGGYDFEVVELGPPVYHVPVPSAKYRGPLIPAGDGEGLIQRPAPPAPVRRRSKVPLVPTAEEVAQLPRLARAAFAERCALRVRPVFAAPEVTAADAARVIFETATIDSPLTSQLRCIRRDFVRLKRLARKEKWTDDTPVPPDVFGPLWPEGVEPYWAVEQPPAPPA
jgi:hypothetical protein